MHRGKRLRAAERAVYWDNLTELMQSERRKLIRRETRIDETLIAMVRELPTAPAVDPAVRPRLGVAFRGGSMSRPLVTTTNWTRL